METFFPISRIVRKIGKPAVTAVPVCSIKNSTTKGCLQSVKLRKLFCCNLQDITVPTALLASLTAFSVQARINSWNIMTNLHILQVEKVHFYEENLLLISTLFHIFQNPETSPNLYFSHRAYSLFQFYGDTNLYKISCRFSCMPWSETFISVLTMLNKSSCSSTVVDCTMRTLKNLLRSCPYVEINCMADLTLHEIDIDSMILYHTI